MFDVFGHYLASFDIGHWVYFIYAFLAFVSFKLSNYLYRQKALIEYDEQNVYVTSRQLGTEQIPLTDLIRLDIRPESFSIGAIRNKRLNLWYFDENGHANKVEFYSRFSRPLFNFSKPVREHNSEFFFKNWTHSFDLKD